MTDKVVGVIGGMGPEATVDLMMRVIRATPAEDDIDHIRMLVDNNPQVPSRIKAIIEGTGESPAPCMAQMARNLAASGADFLVIPCNTAHYYYDEVCRAVDIPVMNMIDVTVETVLNENASIRTVGLLASKAVLLTGIYTKPFKGKGVDVIYPCPEVQELLMASVCKIKTGKYDIGDREVLQSAAEELVRKRAEALIVACTELSIICDGLDAGVKVYDSSQVLAESIVRMAKGRG
ncbi:MAG: amino acid racemase [Deltaproteobacteria bacterium]|nr:amino acid racemase [Deltaproteobacteria bacterium]MBW2119973.1 amino acid racemase [Deltaproteobacteria bacterium]